MRLIKYLVLFVIMVGLVLVAYANRGAVTLNVVPADLAGWIGWSYSLQLPLFVVILGSVLVGLVLGFIWEWLREHRYRAEMKSEKKARTKLEREMSNLKAKEQKDKGQDEVLALIDGSSRAS